MRIWGISALSHDASLAVIDDGGLRFAGHSERYSRTKNDATLHWRLLEEAVDYGVPDLIVWYERPYLKKLRHARARQWGDLGCRSDIPHRYLRRLRLPFRLPRLVYASHHDAHAIAGCATSGFSRAAVIVADSIGEFRTLSLGVFEEGKGFQTLHSKSYPHSLGLLYSAFTRRCGFTPNEDEYVIMGMAGYGRPRYLPEILEELVHLDGPSFKLRINPHRGIGNWCPNASVEDLAASVQALTEMVMTRTARWIWDRTKADDLVLMGGVALNCVANSRVAELDLFRHIWILPNPGDAGSSIGAAAMRAEQPVTWPGPYLGTEIPGPYPVNALLETLLERRIVGVASGRAEFGPRALGNRSLMADPRPQSMKDDLNAVKGREPFRPFAPVIRAEQASRVFDLPIARSPYMQFVGRCRTPEAYPAIVHVDGTSRVQTVTQMEHPGLYDLLGRWERETGCPLLVNTSLNVRGEPLANTRSDAERFASASGVAVHS
ncbi:MAG: carbamoyltransferase C-terminal domain-containing protein [Solirubrobacteraceae bacterium]